MTGRNLVQALRRLRRDNRGQVLPLVLILLVIGSLMTPPLMSFMSDGLKLGKGYERKSRALYAADAGIEDARWQIKYEHLESTFTDPVYNAYDYTTAFGYDLPSEVNTQNVGVTIQNMWIPANIPTPSQSEASTIIANEKLVVTASVSGIEITMKVSYIPGLSEDLRVTSLGMWLPPGFSYVTGSSNLEANPGEVYYSVPVVSPHSGNQAIIWSFSSVPFSSFPGVGPGDIPQVLEVVFQFTPMVMGNTPDTTGWVTTSGVAGIPYSWDADSKVYKMTAQADGAMVEAYTSKREIRRMTSAMTGDYVAGGNSLMIDTNHDSAGVRDQLLASSNATVSAIPADAQVGAAFLYWSGWRSDAAKVSVFSDTCSNFNNWNNGAAWTVSSNSFRAHYSSGADSVRYLTLKNGLDLSAYGPGTILVSWDQWESGTLESDDGMDFAFSGDGGANWSASTSAFRNDIGGSAARYSLVLPAQYLTAAFKIRFYLKGFTGSDDGYAYLDNIALSHLPPDTSIDFKIDGSQVYLDAGGAPQLGVQPLTALTSQVLPNASGINGFSYSSYRDVTELVKTFSAKAADPATNHSGNGVYTVGSVSGDTGTELSYAGWSLIIVYTSGSTLGHQLYLYDKFIYATGSTNIDFDGDGNPGGHISGFIVPEMIYGETDAAKLTVFLGEGDECYSGDSLKFNGTALSNAQSPANNVWNGKSPGLTADGVDIDTFSITWASGLLQPGDTSAQIDIPTQIDNWNIVYMVLSFRSETNTRGLLGYIIR